jgi:diketogulonate reductase-like aldo/keto reductase
MEETPKTTIKLSDGSEIPTIGLGTFDLKGEQSLPFLREAVALGYRLIDTASFYKNEADIGEAIKSILKDGLVKREDLKIITKLWNLDKEDPETALRQSLKLLQLDYVDIYMIHWPIADLTQLGNTTKYPPLHKTWAALEDCVKKGLCKSLAISNFNVQLILDLLSYAEIKPVVNEIEIHPYLPQEDLVGFCQKYNIQVIGYSPLNKAGVAPVGRAFKELLKEPIIEELAKKYNKTPGQIVLNWDFQRKVIPIPKTFTSSRLKENIESTNFTLSEGEIKQISGLSCGYRRCDPRVYDTPAFFKTPLFS